MIDHQLLEGGPVKCFASRITFAVLLVLLLPTLRKSSAQTSFTAQLRGTVSDMAGARVPGATVTAVNEATQVAERATTNAEGRYIFNDLRPASYTVRVEASGFKAAVRSEITLRVGQQSDLDLTLEVGDVKTSVEVTSTAPLLNTVSGALGQEVDNRHVTEVPLLDRTILN